MCYTQNEHPYYNHCTKNNLFYPRLSKSDNGIIRGGEVQSILKLFQSNCHLFRSFSLTKLDGIYQTETA